MLTVTLAIISSTVPDLKGRYVPILFLLAKNMWLFNGFEQEILCGQAIDFKIIQFKKTQAARFAFSNNAIFIIISRSIFYLTTFPNNCLLTKMF